MMGRRSLEQGLMLGLLVLICLAPWLLGANRTWAWAGLAAGFYALAGLAALAAGFGALEVKIPRCTRLVMTMFFLAWVYMFVQSAPLNDAQGIPSAHYGAPGTAGPMSLDSGATLNEAVKRGSYLCVFGLAVVLLRTRARLTFFAAALLLVAFLEALFGILVHLTGSGWLYSDQGARGSYVNRNHFAGLLEMGSMMGLALMAALTEPAARGGAGARIRQGILRWIKLFQGPRPMVVVGLLILVAGLILSGSRAAAVVLPLSVGIVITGLGFRRGEGMSRRVRSLALVVLLGAAAVGWLGADNLSSRFEAEGWSSSRVDSVRAAMPLLGDYWLWGSGAGTFRWIFPAYKTRNLTARTFEHAHNDYLELAIELGVVGLVPIAGAVMLVIWISLRGLRSGGSSRLRALGAGYLGACIALLAHGLVDFNLQIPANALWFSLCLAGALACATLGNDPRSPTPPRDQRALSSGRK